MAACPGVGRGSERDYRRGREKKYPEKGRHQVRCRIHGSLHFLSRPNAAAAVVQKKIPA